jgi:transposase
METTNQTNKIPKGATRPTSPKPHAPYPPEFRAEAVRLVRAEGASARRVANDLGVHEETLRLWVRQADVDTGRRDGLTTTERAELTQLRRENRLLKEEREILKKAAAFFAKESTIR